MLSNIPDNTTIKIECTSGGLFGINTSYNSINGFYITNNNSCILSSNNVQPRSL